jgi:hypothetical protein
MSENSQETCDHAVCKYFDATVLSVYEKHGLFRSIITKYIRSTNQVCLGSLVKTWSEKLMPPAAR